MAAGAPGTGGGTGGGVTGGTTGENTNEAEGQAEADRIAAEQAEADRIAKEQAEGGNTEGSMTGGGTTGGDTTGGGTTDTVVQRPEGMSDPQWASYQTAMSEEPQITSDMEKVTEQTGGKLQGLEYRLKTPASLADKIVRDMTSTGTSEEDVLAHIYDTVRYTNISEPEDFTQNYNNVVDALKEEGYTVVRVKNTIADATASYRGVNTIVESPDGYRFELQFHTPESFDVKQTTHALFELQRAASTPANEKLALAQQQAQMSAGIVTPPGSETIKSFSNLP